MLITFDDKGISSHPNHISLYLGARHWIRSMPQRRSSNVGLYSLTTTSVVRKYAGLLDAPVSLLIHMLRGGEVTRAPRGLPPNLIFLSSFDSYRRAQRCMTDCHRSQMLWFRYGWIMLSRYLIVNDIKRQAIA